MIDATEDYHTCTVCSTTVHDFGPGADAVCDEDGVWMHRSCQEPTSAEEDAYSALDISYGHIMEQAQRVTWF